MRRLLLAALCLVGLTGRARAQSSDDRPSVSISLGAPDERTGARKPIIYLRHLIADPRWGQALDNSLPIVLHNTLEVWRSRDGWIDELLFGTEWQVYVTKEPLADEYDVTVVTGNRPQRPQRFVQRDSAIAYLERPNLVEVVPNRPGRFYYVLTTRITALTDADMDQLERFLAGDPDLDVSGRSGTVLGRGIRRLLLRIAGLPSEVLTARSERFTVTAPPQDDER
jgi:Domain of unknown function (DUF4390)